MRVRARVVVVAAAVHVCVVVVAAVVYVRVVVAATCGAALWCCVSGLSIHVTQEHADSSSDTNWAHTRAQAKSYHEKSDILLQTDNTPIVQSSNRFVHVHLHVQNNSVDQIDTSLVAQSANTVAWMPLMR